jgi:hypothetical protein
MLMYVDVCGVCRRMSTYDDVEITSTDTTCFDRTGSLCVTH